MRNLIEIFNTNDLRWLLDVDVLPKEYDTDYLVPVLDSILFEYEELKGDRFYTSFLKKSDYSVKDASKLLVLRGCYELKLCGAHEEADNLLKQVKSKSETIEQLEKEMGKLTTTLKVRAMKQAKNVPSKTSFGEMCAQISKASGASIKDVRESTVAEFVGYEKIIERMNAK